MIFGKTQAGPNYGTCRLLGLADRARAEEGIDLTTMTVEFGKKPRNPLAKLYKILLESLSLAD